MSHIKNKNLFYLIFIIFFIGCEGDVGPQGIGLNSLTNVTNEPAGTNCENGGIKIEIGTDSNENGVLDSEEILNTSYVCNGVNGATSLTVVSTESAGENCKNGGLRVDSGVDANRDGTLDETEISATAYVCNGIDGNNSLTKITNEPAGPNCSNGGAKIESGIDENGDGTLDADEIEVIRYVCNGLDGGFDEQILFKIIDSNNSVATETRNAWPPRLRMFDKSNFVGVDSAVFVVYGLVETKTGGCCGTDVTSNITIRLYDITNNQAIANSDIVTDDIPENSFKNSLNIINDLPTGPADLGVQWTQDANIFVTVDDCYLVLFRSN